MSYKKLLFQLGSFKVEVIDAVDDLYNPTYMYLIGGNYINNLLAVQIAEAILKNEKDNGRNNNTIG